MPATTTIRPGYKSDQTFSYDKDTGEAALTRQWHDDGAIDRFTGAKALANYGGAEGQLFRAKDPQAAHRLIRGHNDRRESMGYKVGDWLRSYANNGSHNIVSRAIGDNPLQGAAVMGGAGFLGGHLANWLLGKLRLVNEGEGKFHWIGGALGALGGGTLGYFRGKEHGGWNKMAGFHKEAAMFKDPRNFILEKLQSATDLSMTDKALLAAQVRNMDPRRADRLSGMVRAAMGFGVGAIVARFCGTNLRGTMVGGLAGALGTGIINAMRKKF